VAITYEMIHDTRIIPLTAAQHLGSSIRSGFGASRGHWEGDTLVVETTNFLARSVYRNANPDRLKITERFTRVGPNTLRWAVTVDDATTWTKPWTFSLPLTVNSAEPMMPYECHEGNYGLKNILSAARAEGRNAAQAAKPEAGSVGRVFQTRLPDPPPNADLTPHQIESTGPRVRSLRHCAG